MKTAARFLPLLFALGAVSAAAQTQNIPQVQHVIILVQENRTPDNLFHEDTTLIANGAHVRPPNDSGPCGPALTNANCVDPVPQQNVQLTALPLGIGFSPGHKHYPDWQCTFDNGGMDGACHITMQTGNSSSCPSGNLQYCPYTYVVNDTPVQPYFHIAEQFGFANWMFSTHQGPSQPAHLFLFAGTSAPDLYNDPLQNCGSLPCWQWFVSENGDGTKAPGGCLASANAFDLELPPETNGNQWPLESKGVYAPWRNSRLPLLESQHPGRPAGQRQPTR